MLDETALTFGPWLRHRRQALHLTQQQLGQLASCSAAMIRKIEADERLPSRDVAQHLAAALQVPDHDHATFLRFARGELLHDAFTLPVIAALPPRPLHAPTNVPIPPNVLIGRQDELTKVVALLKQPEVRLVTLTGPGGVGKTRLGIAVTDALRDRFVDGIVFVNLAPITDPALVLSTIATTLDVKETAGRNLRASVQAYLRERRLLLLLDNFEQVLDAGLVVADLLSVAPWQKVLVTSREVLHVRGEHEIIVQPLALPKPSVHDLDVLKRYDAVQLFIARAQAAKADFEVTPANASAVSEICARLDGLPLAIELAAARIKILSPEALLARLSNRLQLLTGGQRDLPARQQTIRATIDWSFNLLDPAEQQLFARLAVFTGGCTLDAAEAVCDEHGSLRGAMLDSLQSLVDKSLLQMEGAGLGPRFTMLETLREHAVEQLTLRDEWQKLRQRHSQWIIDFAEVVQSHSWGAEQTVWFQRCEQETANLRAALAWLAEQHQWFALIQLCGAVGQYWSTRGQHMEGYLWLEAAFKAAQLPSIPSEVARVISPIVLARALRVFAEVDARHSSAGLTRAIDYLEQSLDLEELANNGPGIGASLVTQGTLVKMTGDLPRARELYTAALGRFRQENDPNGTGYTLMTLGELLAEHGAYDEAHRFLADSLHVLTRAQNPRGMAQVLGAQGHLAHMRGDLQAAIHLFEQALLLWTQLGAQIEGAFNLSNLGLIAAEIGDDAKARAYLEEGAAVFHDIRLREWLNEDLGWVLLVRGETFFKLHHLEEARNSFKESLEIYHHLENVPGMLDALEGYALVAEAQGLKRKAVQLQAAVSQLREARNGSTAIEVSSEHRDALDSLQAALEPGLIIDAREQGRVLSLEQAVAYALGRTG